jgi:hypothetical protein
MYYLVQDPEASCFVFTVEDPRQDGFRGPVREGVTLVIPPDLHTIPPGVTAPHPCVAVSEQDATQYRVFKYRNECRAAGYRPLSELYTVQPSWTAYLAEARRS